VGDIKVRRLFDHADTSDAEHVRVVRRSSDVIISSFIHSASVRPRSCCWCC